MVAHHGTLREIKFSLLENAISSFRQAIDLLAWRDIGTDETRLKYAVSHAAHALELLLKEKLRRIHPAFIFVDIDKYPSIGAPTVGTEKAQARLRAIGGITFSDEDVGFLKGLRRARNAIEHYEWKTNEKDARVIVAKALSLAACFANEHLGVDIVKPLQKDDTWTVILYELHELAQDYGKRIEAKYGKLGNSTVECLRCGGMTVSSSGFCELCGEWQDLDSEG
jgi:hypothetical protein